MQQFSNHSERQPEAGGPPKGVGIGKFHPDGSVRPFPGNTLICHLPEDSVLQAPLRRLYERLRLSELAPLYSLLPPSSWHMTIFEGVCDQVREPGFWPADLPLDAPLTACDALFEDRLASFDPKLDPPFEMEIAGWKPLVGGISLALKAATDAEERRLRDLRNRLSDLLGLRHPGHETYVFHLSIAYIIRHLSDAQRDALSAMMGEQSALLPAKFKLGAPEFCRFEDMFAFRRLFFLKTAG